MPPAAGLYAALVRGSRRSVGRIGGAGGQQRHASVGDAHHAGDIAEHGGAAELAGGAEAHEDGQVGEQRPAHGADALGQTRTEC